MTQFKVVSILISAVIAALYGYASVEDASHATTPYVASILYSLATARFVICAFFFGTAVAIIKDGKR